MAFIGVRALAEGILQDTTEDLRVQCSRVDQAFSRRCEELVEAKTHLEVKLAQVDGQMDQVLLRQIKSLIGWFSFCLCVPVCRFWSRLVTRRQTLCLWNRPFTTKTPR